MSFHIHSLGLNEAINDAVRQIGKRLYDGAAPQSLYHYTRAETVASIINSRCLWATCLAEQTDQSELLHAISIIRDASQELIQSGVSELTADVLRQIPVLMEERRRWFFIACFCGEHSSPHHHSTYGTYCLCFTAPWTSSSFLAIQTSAADFWYQRVIYDETVQRRAMLDGLVAIADALRSYTAGVNEGPWMGMMSCNCARIAAEQLLAIAIGFKHRKFTPDEEWRIVCCPHRNPLSSAPDMADQLFSVAIRSDVRKHVDLIILRELNLFEPLLIPPVPFVQIFPNYGASTATELEMIRESLRNNGRGELLEI